MIWPLDPVNTRFPPAIMGPAQDIFDLSEVVDLSLTDQITLASWRLMQVKSPSMETK